MPRWLPLVTGLILFVVVVVASIVYVLLSDAAGTQRGLVIQNRRPEAVTLTLDSEKTAFAPGEVKTIIVDKKDYPRTYVVTDGESAVLFEQTIDYSELSEAQFRVAITPTGIAFPSEPQPPTLASTPSGGDSR